MSLTIAEITEQDMDEILAFASITNEQHVIPCLNDEGQRTMRASMKKDVSAVIDRKKYQTFKGIRFVPMSLEINHLSEMD